MTAAVLLVLAIVSGVAATARLRSRQLPRLRTDPAPPQHAAQRRSRRDVDGYVPVRAPVRLDPADERRADRLAQALDVSDPDP